MRRRLAIAWVALACSCEVGALPPSSRVDGLRLLALVTATPDVVEGAAPIVSAFVLAPGGDPPEFVRWRICAERDVGDPRQCPGSALGVDLGVGPSVTLPPLAARGLPTTYLVLASACAAVTPTLDAVTGRALCQGRASAVEAFRRVTVREGRDLNHNPSLRSWSLSRDGTEVRVEGEVVALPRCERSPCAPWTVAVEPAEGSSEVTPEGRESLTASFYATDGDFDRPRDASDPGVVRSLSARWTVRDGVAGLRLAFVLRDLRGGEVAGRVAITWR